MKRVDQWETVATIAVHACRPRTVRGARYRVGAFRAANACDRLQRLARSLNRIYVDMCNGTIGDSEWILDQDKAERHASRLEARAVATGRDIGVIVTTQRDPRGPAIRVWADKEDGRLLGVFS